MIYTSIFRPRTKNYLREIMMSYLPSGRRCADIDARTGVRVKVIKNIRFIEETGPRLTRIILIVLAGLTIRKVRSNIRVVVKNLQRVR